MSTRAGPALTTPVDVPPLEVFDLCPPHRPGAPLVLRDGTAARAPGTIMCVRLDARHTTGGVGALLTRLRLAHPACAIALWMRHATPSALLGAMVGVAEAFVRAVIVDAVPDINALRLPLTDPRHLASDVLAWCRIRGVTVDPMTLALTEEIGHRALRDHCPPWPVRHFSPSGLRSRFRRVGLPPPAEWQRLFAGLGVALQLQRSHRTPLLRIAIERGYADHSSLSKALKRTFRTTPPDIRATCGWEWLLHRWYARQPEWAGDAVGCVENDSRVARDASRVARRGRTLIAGMQDQHEHRA